jgi:DNA polymerase III alpha subunit (gram-positive type)
MSDEKTPAQGSTKSQPASQISQIFGPIKLLPGESEAVYRAGLIGTISELGAATHLQSYLAEKIFQCLWWMRRYEVQKQVTIVNAMVDLLTRHDTDKKRRTAITHNLQAQLWNDPQMLKIIEALGHTPESLAAKATSNTREEIQKIDSLIALRVKTLGQLQQSYEALVNRSVMQERLKLQNELLKRDLQAIDVHAVEQVESEKVKARGQRKAKSGK